MKTIRQLSAFLLVLALSITTLQTTEAVHADTQTQATDMITVNLKVEDVDSTLISESVTLTQNDAANINKTYTIESGGVEIPILTGEQLTAAHVLGKYIAGTSSAPTEDLTFSYGSPAHIRGEKNVDYYSYWSFRVNNTSPADNTTGFAYTPDTYPVKDGDTIVFFRQACYDSNAGDWGAYTNYSWFDRDHYETAVNTPVTVTYSKDDGFGSEARPAADETISVYKQSQLIQTLAADENGTAALSFDKAGIYTIAGGRLAANGIPENSHASAVITVTSAAEPTGTPSGQTAVWSGFRNENGRSGANTTSAKTPTLAGNAGAKWQVKFEKEESIAYNSDPVITETHLYVVCKNTLYQLDKQGTICSTLTLAAPMNSVCRMTFHENRLFIPLSGGIMQCVDIETMSSRWVSEAFGLQSLSTVFYANGLLYAGTTNAAGTEGLYYCLSAADGRTQWTYKDPEKPCGYYWSGAAAGKGYVLLGGDNGRLISHSLTDDTVYDTCELSTSDSPLGKIRAGITYDSKTDAYYTTTNNGYLYRVKMNADGTFGTIKPTALFSASAPFANCTSTPTIYNGRIYVCSYDAITGSRLNVVDASSMQLIYAAALPDCPDIKSSPLVSAGGCEGKVLVYFTQNEVPGGISYIEDTNTAEESRIQTLFAPQEGAQFCLSSIAADADGTLYYSNDSGTLFAVQDGFAVKPEQPSSAPLSTTAPATAPPAAANPSAVPPSAPAAATASPKSSGTPSSRVKAQNRKPGKPKKIQWSKKKAGKHAYRVTFRWNKGRGTSFTKVIIRGAKTKARKAAFTRTCVSTSKKVTVKLKKGSYTVRFYGCQSSAKKSGAVTRKLRLK